MSGPTMGTPGSGPGMTLQQDHIKQLIIKKLKA